MLYKFTPSIDIAEQISIGIFRFYELTKYKKIEDELGRSDPAEGSMSFPETEYLEYPEKLPIGKFKDVEFKCISAGPDDEYLKQYFVFCMSTQMNKETIGDSEYVVELHKDNFDLFSILLELPPDSNASGQKIFSHSEVEYYDIHNHPKPFNSHRWKEVYLKHSSFGYQNEYRAALFVSDSFVERTSQNPLTIERKIRKSDGEYFDFNLKVSVSSGVDSEGWRYVELDISEFAENMCPNESSKITKLRNS